MKPTSTLTSAYMPMLRIVAAVTWTAAKCSNSTCIYLSDSLIPETVSDLTFQLP